LGGFFIASAPAAPNGPAARLFFSDEFDGEAQMATAARRWATLNQLDEWLELPMIALSVAWLAIVVWELVSGSSALLETLGTGIWIVFLAEFAIRLALAPQKLPFLKANWITVLALAVPALRLFRFLSFLRAARALRGFRLVRIVGTANRSMNALRRSLARRGFGYVLGLTMLVLGLGAAGMLSFEPAAEVPGGFTSYGDALWWTAMLLTSLGSQFWPVTTEGRVLAVLLSLYGFATFGYITASFASFFVGRDAETKSGPIAGSSDMARLVAEVRALRAELAARNAA
jgi:voltage-gated potassium channel